MRSVSDSDADRHGERTEDQRKRYQESGRHNLARLPQTNDFEAQGGVSGERTEAASDDRGSQHGVHRTPARFEPRRQIDVEKTWESRVEPSKDDSEHERTEQVHNQQ